ncbi:sensor histidine kinase [Streptomyces sp. NPDC091272]|uniref:sensor histidine kinase n=1 Tax=Streptomyces sp. NPDC091272 TaxID=3365981 RepID=UPI00382F06ED
MGSQTTQSSGGFTAWPSTEELSRLGVPRVRMAIDIALWLGMGLWILWEAYDSGVFQGVALVVPPLVLVAVTGAAELYDRQTVRHRLLPSLAVLGTVTLVAVASHLVGAPDPGAVLLIICGVQATVRLPLAVGLPAGAAIVSMHAVLSEVSAREQAVVTCGVLAIGYMLRLDAQARGSGFRLLAQERAARTAEAESAALAERARIAREIHDVLAHSLSAQMVHLEAARLLIEREPQGAFRDGVLERVVAARGMAREGLAETRQALSALRGDMVPVEDYLRELGAVERAEIQVSGERQKLTADASQAVRRVAQEALTNVRKHAPGAAVRILLAYGPRAVTLEVRDWGRPGARGELAATGAGYGLLGMRERAELLGGTLEAGREGKGFVVKLRMPV